MYFHATAQCYEFKSHNTIELLHTSRDLPQPTGSRYCGLKDMKAVVTPKAVPRLMSGISSITWSRTERQSCSTWVANVGVESSAVRGVPVELDTDKELASLTIITRLRYFLTAAEIIHLSSITNLRLLCLSIIDVKVVSRSEIIFRVVNSQTPGGFHWFSSSHN